MTDHQPLHAIAALLRDVFHERKFDGPGYLNWLYRENPDGQEIAANRFDGAACLAHYVVIPAEYHSASRALPLRMALSLNTAVSPKARMKGLFVNLAEETFRRAADAGIVAVTGVANENSTHGFVERLGFRLVTPLPVTVGISSMVSRGYQTVDAASLRESDLAELVAPYLQQNAATQAWSPHWTGEKLAWRLRSPVGRYRVHTGPRALAISTADKRNGIPVAILLKTFTLGAAQEEVRSMLGAVCRAHRTPLYLHSGFADRIDVPGFPLPAALRPKPLNYIYRPLLSEAPARAAFRLGHYEFLDFDAY